MKRLSLLCFLAVLVFQGPPALAAPVNTPFGSCTGGASNCQSSTGHDSVSIAFTLTVNEQRAISFGSMAVSCNVSCDGTASVDLGLDGSRTYHAGTNDRITLLNGAGGGSPSPGHYTIEGANEGNATQVYVFFGDNSGGPIDFSGDSFYPGAATTLTGPTGQTFTMDKFVINESGHDVYGHYIDNRGGAFNPAPGIANPFDHAHTANPGGIDVVVGATLHTVLSAAPSYPPGKYVGTFDIMVSY